MSVTITREVLNALFTALNTSLNKGWLSAGLGMNAGRM